jgi:hypothetical protein
MKGSATDRLHLNHRATISTPQMVLARTLPVSRAAGLFRSGSLAFEMHYGDAAWTLVP